MNTSPDYTAAGEGGSFDPAQAAALLDQTTQQTRRKTAPAQPWLLAIRAVAVLLVLGACWLNVRGQHPYSARPPRSCRSCGGSWSSISWPPSDAHARDRTGSAGNHGCARRRSPSWRWPGSRCCPLIGGLASAGASNADGLLADPAHGAADPRRPGLGGRRRRTGRLAPVRRRGSGWPWSVPSACSRDRSGAWAVDGVGLCIVLLGAAVAIVWPQHRSVVRS